MRPCSQEEAECQISSVAGGGKMRRPAEPGAVWHNAVGVGEGNREWTQMGGVGALRSWGKVGMGTESRAEWRRC